MNLKNIYEITLKKVVEESATVHITASTKSDAIKKALKDSGSYYYSPSESVVSVGDVIEYDFSNF